MLPITCYRQYLSNWELSEESKEFLLSLQLYRLDWNEAGKDENDLCATLVGSNRSFKQWKVQNSVLLLENPEAMFHQIAEEFWIKNWNKNFQLWPNPLHLWFSIANIPSPNNIGLVNNQHLVHDPSPFSGGVAHSWMWSTRLDELWLLWSLGTIQFLWFLWEIFAIFEVAMSLFEREWFWHNIYENTETVFQYSRKYWIVAFDPDDQWMVFEAMENHRWILSFVFLRKRLSSELGHSGYPDAHQSFERERDHLSDRW